MLPGSTFLIKQYNSLRQRTVVASSDRLVIRVKQNLCEEIGRDIFWGVFFFFHWEVFWSYINPILKLSIFSLNLV